LNHEIGDDPVEDGAVEVAGVDIGQEILYRNRSLVGKQLDSDVAVGRGNRDHGRFISGCWWMAICR